MASYQPSKPMPVGRYPSASAMSFSLPQYDYMHQHAAERDTLHAATASPSSPSLSDADTFAGSVGSPAPSSICSPAWPHATIPPSPLSTERVISPESSLAKWDQPWMSGQYEDVFPEWTSPQRDESYQALISPSDYSYNAPLVQSSTSYPAQQYQASATIESFPSMGYDSFDSMYQPASYTFPSDLAFTTASSQPFMPDSYGMGISPSLIHHAAEPPVAWDQAVMDGFEPAAPAPQHSAVVVKKEDVEHEEDAKSLHLAADDDEYEDEEDEEDDDDEWRPSPPASRGLLSASAPTRRTIASSSSSSRPRRLSAQWQHELTIADVVPNLTKRSRGRQVPTVSLNDVDADDEAGSPKRRSSGRRGRSTGRAATVVTDPVTGRARMYVCKVAGCGKCFQRGEHLKRHVRSIHTNEKPFQCPACSKTFSRRDNLFQHTSIHARHTAGSK